MSFTSVAVKQMAGVLENAFEHYVATGQVPTEQEMAHLVIQLLACVTVEEVETVGGEAVGACTRCYRWWSKQKSP